MIISIFALFLLLAVTAVLVKLNWSEKLYSPLLSLTLAGTVTTFITVLLMLKGSESETAFSTLVVLDSQDYLIPVSDFPENGLGLAMQEYLFLTHPEFTVDEYNYKAFESPKNDSEATLFNEELIQYAIFKSIINLQNERTTLSTNTIGVSGKINKPFKVSEIEKKPLKSLKDELSKNRFSKAPAENFSIEHSSYTLPKNTSIKFKRIPTSPKSGPEKQLIIISKPYYFVTEISIEASFGSMNSSPKDLGLDPELSKRCHTYMYIIKIKTNFEKLTAGNWRTEELKNWNEWLISNLEKTYSIQQ